MNSTHAPYPKTDPIERKSVTILRNLLDSEMFHLNISEGEKGPNSDGNIELLNKKYQEIAKVEVQVKTLPKEYLKKPRYKVPIKLFDYAHFISLHPFILIVVDVKNECARAHSNYSSNNGTVTI